MYLEKLRWEVLLSDVCVCFDLSAGREHHRPSRLAFSVCPE